MRPRIDFEGVEGNDDVGRTLSRMRSTPDVIVCSPRNDGVVVLTDGRAVGVFDLRKTGVLSSTRGEISRVDVRRTQVSLSAGRQIGHETLLSQFLGRWISHHFTLKASQIPAVLFEVFPELVVETSLDLGKVRGCFRGTDREGSAGAQLS